MKVVIPQQHLLPKQDGKFKLVGPKNNKLDQTKMFYIVNMRKELCRESICYPDGSLKLKYFNIKKGHYWTQKESAKLLEGILKHGACKF